MVTHTCRGKPTQRKPYGSGNIWTATIGTGPLTGMAASGISAVGFQDGLNRALAGLLRRERPGHLLISGPVGCGQSTAARALAERWRQVAGNNQPNLVRAVPGRLSYAFPGEAIAELRNLWEQAHAGVLHIPDIEVLLADRNAVPILAQMRELAAGDAPVSLILSGDYEATGQLHALAPDLHAHMTSARVNTLSPRQMAMILERTLHEENWQTSEGFAGDAETVLRRVRPVGDLSNSRIVRAIARSTTAGRDPAVHGPLKVEDLDLRALRTVDTREGAGFVELDGLIGLTDIKSTVRQWVANFDVMARREQLGLHASGMGQHMVFKGPAGTAKTTVARIVGQVLAETGVLTSGHLVEVQRAGLVGDRGEPTSRRVIDVVKRSLGGVLFIDEAYTLTADGTAQDQGKEAVDTLLKTMEDYREEFVVIVAGYPLEMEQFLNSNPGLRSRFPRVLEFPSYTPEELLQILRYLSDKRGYTIEPDVFQALLPSLSMAVHYPYFGNGRHMRNMLEGAISRQANRLTRDSTDDDLRTLTLSDFDDEYARKETVAPF